ncbi:MAG TPA: DinB family protein [Chitinophagaceae bacterium]|nr:DinB family protein [Chitinophagaceae bacterium]
MSQVSDFLVTTNSGYTAQVGRLVSMLHYARQSTLAAVEGLTIAQLDHLEHPQSNSIGALLLHIAAAEMGYQASTFYKRALTEEENAKWGNALALGDKARQSIKGNPLSFYLDRLQKIREITLQELALRNDEWLEEETSYGPNRINNYFKWFYVLTHEVNHRGQIRMLRNHLS